jgi:putative ABC transport system substrate-binding protein
MRRREFIAGLGAASWTTRAVGQTTGLRRVGLLSLHGAGHEREGRIGAYVIVPALEALNYKNGANVVLHVAHADGDRTRMRPLADKLVQAGVDVIVAVGTDATQAARAATSSIPIVMAGVGDPLGSGFVASLSRPRGNVTGTALLNHETAEKQLEALREAAPRVRRVAVLRRSPYPSHDRMMARMEGTAAALNVTLIPVVVETPGSLAGQFETLRSSGAEAVMVLPNPAFDDMREEIAELALRHRLPGAGWQPYHVHAGLLLSYGPDLSDMHARAASYVARILKGTPPADLPVEQPERFKLALNLRTAKTLGLAVPVTILARADEVIE